MLTAEQVKERQTGLGSSDAGAVLGLNPYQSPLEVYLEKVGERAPFEGNEQTYFGARLEDIIADEYARRTGNAVRRLTRTQRHPRYPWMLAHPDRSATGLRTVVECKTADKWLAKEWGPGGETITDAAESDGIVPQTYVAQVHHQMAVLDFSRADLAVLIGGNDFRIYHFERDPSFEEIMIDIEREFWRNHIEARVPPPPSVLRDLVELYGTDNGMVMHADAEIEQACTELAAVKAVAKEAESRKDALELRIKSAMGNAAILRSLTGRTLATWKSHNKALLDGHRLQKERPELAAEFEYKIKVRPFLLK